MGKVQASSDYLLKQGRKDGPERSRICGRREDLGKRRERISEKRRDKTGKRVRAKDGVALGRGQGSNLGQRGTTW